MSDEPKYEGFSLKSSKKSKNITVKKQIINKDILLKNNNENLENYFLRLRKLN